MHGKIEKTIVDYFRKRPEVSLVYLFGSQVTGRAGALSDVDIAIGVEANKIRRKFPYGYKSHILAELMGKLNTNAVDLVLLHEASYFLRFQIMTKGKVLFSRKPINKVFFEADVMTRYPDIKRLTSIHYGA
jgi:predicted nucleotidyltransferase